MSLFKDLALRWDAVPSFENYMQDYNLSLKNYNQQIQQIGQYHHITAQQLAYKKFLVSLEASQIDESFRVKLTTSVDNINQLLNTNPTLESMSAYINPVKMAEAIRVLGELLVKVGKWLITQVSKFLGFFVNVFKVSFSRREWLIRQTNRLSDDALKRICYLHFNNVEVSLEANGYRLYADDKYKVFDLETLLSSTYTGMKSIEYFAEGLTNVIHNILDDVSDENYQRQFETFNHILTGYNKNFELNLGAYVYIFDKNGELTEYRTKRPNRVETIDPDEFVINFKTLHKQKAALGNIANVLESLRKDYAGRYGRGFVSDVKRLRGLSEQGVELIKRCTSLIAQHAKVASAMLDRVGKIDDQYCKTMKIIIEQGVATLQR